MENLPTKESIREKYAINEDTDFEVQQLPEIPDPQKLLQEGNKIEKKGFWGDFEVWTKTTIIGGVLMAVLFVTNVVRSVETIYKYGNIVYSNTERIKDYAQHFADYTKDKAIGFLVHTDKPPTEEDKKYQQWAIFPTGSLVYPISGSWKPS
ncbi:MAG: hypothetical protein IH623_28875 [Verrucomicrobia bacterium]|nr:hypothetical protein [Verrucomicrobiota bacterium]